MNYSSRLPVLAQVPKLLGIPSNLPILSKARHHWSSLEVVAAVLFCNWDMVLSVIQWYDQNAFLFLLLYYMAAIYFRFPCLHLDDLPTPSYIHLRIHPSCVARIGYYATRMRAACILRRSGCGSGYIVPGVWHSQTESIPCYQIPWGSTDGPA